MSVNPLLVVAAAIADDSGRLLLHCRPAGKDHAGLWEFPGGKVDAGEDTRGALSREIAEETGLRIDPIDFIPVTFAEGPGASSPILLLLFAAHRWSGTARPLEGGTLRFVPQGAIADYALAPLDRELLSRMPRLETGVAKPENPA